MNSRPRQGFRADLLPQLPDWQPVASARRHSKSSLVRTRRTAISATTWLKTEVRPGLGPYMMRARRANERCSLRAQPRYWYDGAEEDFLTPGSWCGHIKEPASQRLLLEKGEIDLARSLNLRTRLAAVASKNLDTTSRRWPGKRTRVLYLGLNQKNANLAKPEVREAPKWLNELPRRDQEEYRGRAPQGTSGFSAGRLPRRDPRTTLQARCRQERKELLAKAGSLNGFRVTMDVRSTPGSRRPTSRRPSSPPWRRPALRSS